MAMATATKKSKVVWSKRYFPMEVAVFEHAPNGDGRPSYTVKVTRSFRRNEESEWETSDYLSPPDLLPASKLLSEAHSVIYAKQQKAYEERREAATGSTVEDIPF
jgi:hypothetical protein